MLSRRAALAFLIAVEAIAFGYMSETIVFPAIIVVAALLGVGGRWRYRVSQDRQVILALVAALLFVVKWRVQPHSLFDDAMTYLSPFLHSLGQFLLVLQVAALYVHQDRDLLPLSLPWPGVFVMVSAGDVTVGSWSAQRAVFQLLALAFTTAAALYFAASARAAAGLERRPYGAGKLGVLSVLLAGTAVGAWLGASALHRYEHALDKLVTELLNPAVSSSSAGFPSRARLGSVAQRKSERADDIALRVYADQEPGYLRGKSYHWLTTVHGHLGEATQWEEAPSASDKPAHRVAEELLEPAARDGMRFVFDLGNPRPPLSRRADPMEVWLEAPQWGVYSCPPRATDVLTPEDRIRRDERQVISGTDAGVVTYGVRADAPYDRVPFVRSTPVPGVISRQTLTFIPHRENTAGGDPQVQARADEIFAGCRSFEEHVEAVETWFRTRYGYTIGIDPPAGDPLRWFLVARPNAHCEYFAQAAAFLLRTRGIPTRYVTGFVATERNEYGGYWIARNEHAHAWCEAWDDRLGWVVVEATPPAGVPAAEPASAHKQLWEYLSGAATQFRYRFGEGGWNWLFARVGEFLFTPAGCILLALAAGYIAIRFRMRRAAAAGPALSRAVVEMNRLLARLDRRLARAGLVRGPGETLARFATRVESETGDSDAARWYRDYADARYTQPDPVAITELRHRLATLPPPRRRMAAAINASSAFSNVGPPLPGERGQG